MLDLGAFPEFQDAKFVERKGRFFMENQGKKRLWGDLLALYNSLTGARWDQALLPQKKRNPRILKVGKSLEPMNPTFPQIHIPRSHIHTALKSIPQQGLFHFLFHPLGILALCSPHSLPLAAKHGWFGSTGGIFGSLLALGRHLWHEPKPMEAAAPRNATLGEAPGTGQVPAF